MSTDAPRIRWATDVHLDFVAPAERAAFARALADDAPEGVVLCGDIAEAPTVAAILAEIEQAVACPIWFVLGHHDFCGGSVDAVRTRAANHARIGGISSAAWAPWFTCVAVGEVLREAAAAHPDRELLVL